MSHIPEQPHEVPFREVEHDLTSERIDEDGRDFLGHIGRAEAEEWWGTDAQWKETRRDLLRRDKARGKLGGFGFR